MNTTSEDQTTPNCITICNGLLRGEISAVETYTQAIEKFSSDPIANRLHAARERHENSVKLLRDNIIRMGGTPDSDSGAWGTFAKAVEGAAKLLGETAALAALQAGEEYGQKDYESALEGDEMLDDCKTLVKEELLPAVHNNQLLLKELQEAC